MKIIHFVSSFNFGGIEQHVYELATDQMENNEVIIICNDYLEPYYKDRFNVIKITNFSRRNIFQRCKLKKRLKKEDIDILHTHGTKTTSIISKINKKNSYAHISTIHNIKKDVSAYNNSDHVIAVSSELLKNITINSTVITNWISFDPKKVLSNIKIKENHALAVGRFEKAKGFDFLIKSWMNIESDLKIIGEGSQLESLNDLIKELGLEKKITIEKFLPFTQILNEYAKAKVVIISSRNEGGPRVALEALALRTPVLSTNVGHMNSILPNELLCEPDSLESLKEYLEKYMPNLKSINQSAIFDYVQDEFSLKSKSKKIDSIYKKLI
tara:strand:- start:284 stop:1264 length:981 start_codon:yes stop_codon:yes gene_type:complete